MFCDLTWEEYSDALDRLADEVLACVGVDQPPVDAQAVARAIGITVSTDAGQTQRARYARLRDYRNRRPSRPTIFLQADPRCERRHWAVAHEIGEHKAAELFKRVGLDPLVMPDGARETVANHFSSRLLLPVDWFRAAGRDVDWDLSRLKAIFETASHELIARRMLEVRSSILVRIYDNGQVGFRRSNLPGQLPDPPPVETEALARVHRTGRPETITDGPRRTDIWPIHEPTWRREIVIRELPDAVELDYEVDEYFQSID